MLGWPAWISDSTDRVYVVTGGSGGLGRATAEALVSDGAKVVVSAAATRTSVDEAVDELGPEAATGVVADNADPATPPARSRRRARRTDGSTAR